MTGEMGMSFDEVGDTPGPADVWLLCSYGQRAA